MPIVPFPAFHSIYIKVLSFLSLSYTVSNCFISSIRRKMSTQERELFAREVQELEASWKVDCLIHTHRQLANHLLPCQHPRYAHVTRPYTAASVVSKRGTIPITYPSHLQAQKLWSLLESHAKNGTPSHTYGALDPVQITQMAKYLETVYVSGWQSSSTASSTNEPGPDLAGTPTLCSFQPLQN